MKKWGIAFTKNGGLPPKDPIVSWKQVGGAVQTWDSMDEALKANDRYGWQGYVAEYPSGRRESA